MCWLLDQLTWQADRMGREHDHRRTFVRCTECNRVLPARRIETADEPYWQLIGLANRGCPDCGNDDFETLHPR